MPKKSVFDFIFKWNKDLIPEHFDKKTRKRLYNRARNRCKAKKRRNKDFDECLYGELKREMYFFQMAIEPAQKYQRKKDVHVDDIIETIKTMKPIRFWDDPKPEFTSKDLEKQFNKEVQDRFERAFCPVCKSNVCRCREEE